MVINIQAQPASDRGSDEFDTTSISNLFERFRSLSDSLQVPYKITPDLLFQLALYAKKNQSLPDPEEVKDDLLEAFQTALASMVEMRKKEGLQLAIDLKMRAKVLDDLVGSVEGYADGAVAKYRQLLFSAFATGGSRTRSG